MIAPQKFKTSKGSGIKRALTEWDKIDFDNDESGNLHVTPYRRVPRSIKTKAKRTTGGFTATIHRKSSGKSSNLKFFKQPHISKIKY